MRLIRSFVLLSLVFSSACGQSPEDSHLAQAPASPERALALHQNLVKVLEKNYPDEKGSVWTPSELTLASDWIVQSPERLWGLSAQEISPIYDCSPAEAGCDKTFLRYSCESDRDCATPSTICAPLEASVSQLGEEPQKLCLAPGDRLMDRVYLTMTKAEEELDFISLSMPTGRLRTAVTHALAILSQRPEVPRIRLLMSGARPALPNFLKSTDKVLDELMGEVRALTPQADRLRINLAWLAGKGLSWNHAKIIVADGQYALSGGHNLWDVDYLSPNPVFDLSMAYSGPAAAAARDFSNKLWELTDEGMSAFPKNLGRFEAFKMPAQSSGATNTIALGRLGRFGSNPSDLALTAMFDLAQSSIRISQQGLYNQVVSPLTRSFALDAIIEAAARGVQIQVVQSNNFPIGGYGSADGAKVYKIMVDELAKKLNSLWISEAKARQLACARITYAPFRFSAQLPNWGTSKKPIGNHAKLVIVDDAAFYIGSHNLYPANLIEFGNIVADADITAQFKAQYWDKLWKASLPYAHACPS